MYVPLSGRLEITAPVDGLRAYS